MAFKNKAVVALVPARGGSKAVPGKNLRSLGGKPLVTHTLRAAIGCDLVDQVVLSSDSNAILSLGREAGVVIHRRSAIASNDSATAFDVVSDFINYLGPAKAVEDSYLVYLQPTSPFRTSAHIRAAFELMMATECDMCVSVVETTQSPYKSYTLDSKGRLRSLFDEAQTNANRQSLPSVYHPNGAIYIFPVHQFVRRGVFPTNGAVPYIMSVADSIDIDSEEDFVLAESLCRRS
ncbi:acylneuraminate cytidylyltransferase family protein [beta proteobacterium MWH-UniP1]